MLSSHALLPLKSAPMSERLCSRRRSWVACCGEGQTWRLLVVADLTVDERNVRILLIRCCCLHSLPMLASGPSPLRVDDADSERKTEVIQSRVAVPMLLDAVLVTALGDLAM